MECRHVWRPTTNGDGGTDGVICIHCLAWRSFMDRLNGSVYINDAMSLERPLEDKEYKRMKLLGKKLFGGRDWRQ